MSRPKSGSLICERVPPRISFCATAALSDTALQAYTQELLSFHGKLHWKLVENLLAETADDHVNGVFRRNAALPVVKTLVLTDPPRVRTTLQFSSMTATSAVSFMLLQLPFSSLLSCPSYEAQDIEQSPIRSFVIVCVNLDVVLPFVWYCRLLENSFDRADRLTGPTIDTFYGIDVELTRFAEGLRLVLPRMDAAFQQP